MGVVFRLEREPQWKMWKLVVSSDSTGMFCTHLKFQINTLQKNLTDYDGLKKIIKKIFYNVNLKILL